MGSAVAPCPVCGRPMPRGRVECEACTQFGRRLIDGRRARDAGTRSENTPDVVALLAFLNGLFAVLFALLGGTVSPWLGAYLGVITSGTGLGCGVAGLIRTRPRAGRRGRWLAAAGVATSLACLVLILALDVPASVFYGMLFR